ncbi:hypothetical protein [Pontibacillus yanchengensis]|uniref:Uncharacterized protein n=1 Tax=Pontibacillus yanchengensis Y32 TaxID=1385514 RepID=A0A0A2TZK4_9BACI|nr:hypothetical protein [Pontibacillus yanchengensis]KGP74695.1 hypothetical protein N782_00600 [Pontibacillus yanchengensis Y32]
MNAFLGLLKKEMRLSLPFHLVVFAFVILVLGLTYWRLGSIEQVYFLGPILFLIGLHIWYIPGHVLYSFGREARMMHVFLHSPRSIHTLLMSKLLNSIVFFFISLALLNGLLFFVLSNIDTLNDYLATFARFSLWIEAHFVLLSIYFGIFVFFLWTVHQFLKGAVGKWSWLLVGVLFIALPTVLGWFESQVLADYLNWGQLTYDFPSLEGKVEEFGKLELEGNFYIGTYVFHFILCAILYWLGSFILGRKVEV